MIRFGALTLAAILAVGSCGSAGAEQPPPPPSQAPSPAEKDPLPSTTDPNPPTGPGSGTAAPTPTQAPVEPPKGTPPQGKDPGPQTLQTLVPSQGSLDEVDEVTLPAKPAAILSGETTWEEAVPSMQASFKRIGEELARLGVTPLGRPLVMFVKTEENTFQYDAMVPVASAPADKPADAAGLRFGSTPSGKALRFKHSGSYDEIDGTYETLSAYLDAKEVSVQEQFIEEYVSDLDGATDAKLDVNIYALVK